jgi:lysophospholipase L1-like esterase
MLPIGKSSTWRRKIKMKGFYLLAAGLLTGLVIPASTFPHVSDIKSENSRDFWKLKENSSPNVGKTIFSTAEISLPQLSDPSLPKSVESSVYPKTQLVTRQITSGNQLYYERLAALKLGQIYPSLPDDTMQSSLIFAKKTQLSYDDWKSLLAMEAQAMAQNQGNERLEILVGDSLSLWFPREKFPGGRLWLNQGISGDTSNGVLRRVSAFSKTRPNVIYIMAGVNDLRKGLTDETILRNHHHILRKLRPTHPKAMIFIQSILPTRLSTIPNTRIRHLNYQLALIARQEGAYYLNLYDWFTDFQGNLRQELTTDGLHLSREGYEVWQSALHQVDHKLNERIVNSQ